ncbi:glycosyltransferase family A protein [Devosia sp.]|uniref:glycosyltransferase family A protein n=1 Tax=Devosia sp. TaxID=1871048 RepID=UPI002FC9DF24
MHAPDTPLVCICVPTYNAETTIAQTLRSILAQTYRHIVVHVVDNCSTDGTLVVVKGFTDPRITVHENPDNIGGEGNFNRCIALAQGEFTALFHADDVYEPEMVEQQVAFFQRYPAAGGVFTQARLIDQTGTVIGALDLPASLRDTAPLYSFEQIFKAVLEHSNFMICPSFMARTHIYQQEIGRWRGELFRSSADLDVWLRVLERHPCGILPDHLMSYRISRLQWSAAVRDNTERADFFLVIDHYLEKPEVRAVLDESDLRNVERLERRDRAMRAVNALIAGDLEHARTLSSGLFSPEGITNAFQSRRDLLTVVLGTLVSLAVALRASDIARPLLRHFKSSFNR